MTGLREERTRQSRELILQAAAELFAERGYRETSLVDVASRSGVSRGSIPWHFGDKSGLLAAVVSKLYDDMAAVMATPLTAGPRGAHEIGVLATTAIRGNTTKLMLALLHEASDPASPIHESYARTHALMREHIRRWAVDTPSCKAGGVQPDALAAMVVGTVIGVNQQWNLNPDGVDVGAAYDVLVRMLVGLSERDRSGAITTG